MIRLLFGAICFAICIFSFPIDLIYAKSTLYLAVRPANLDGGDFGHGFVIHANEERIMMVDSNPSGIRIRYYTEYDLGKLFFDAPFFNGVAVQWINIDDAQKENEIEADLERIISSAHRYNYNKLINNCMGLALKLYDKHDPYLRLIVKEQIPETIHARLRINERAKQANPKYKVKKNYLPFDAAYGYHSVEDKIFFPESNKPEEQLVDSKLYLFQNRVQTGEQTKVFLADLTTFGEAEITNAESSGLRSNFSLPFAIVHNSEYKHIQAPMPVAKICEQDCPFTNPTKVVFQLDIIPATRGPLRKKIPNFLATKIRVNILSPYEFAQIVDQNEKAIIGKDRFAHVANRQPLLLVKSSEDGATYRFEMSAKENPEEFLQFLETLNSMKSEDKNNEYWRGFGRIKIFPEILYNEKLKQKKAFLSGEKPQSEIYRAHITGFKIELTATWQKPSVQVPLKSLQQLKDRSATWE